MLKTRAQEFLKKQGHTSLSAFIVPTEPEFASAIPMEVEQASAFQLRAGSRNYMAEALLSKDQTVRVVPSRFHFLQPIGNREPGKGGKGAGGKWIDKRRFRR